MINEIKKDAEQRMEKALTALSAAFNKIRTGRAHSSILDSVYVSYYGSDTPLNQVANISVEDGHLVQWWTVCTALIRSRIPRQQNMIA